METVLTNERQMKRKLQTRAFDTLCLHQVKEDRQQQKEERNREDRQGDSQIGSKT